jgi:hypothetical protein
VRPGSDQEIIVAPGNDVIAGVVAAGVDELWNVTGAKELCGVVDGDGDGVLGAGVLDSLD